MNRPGHGSAGPSTAGEGGVGATGEARPTAAAAGQRQPTAGAGLTGLTGRAGRLTGRAGRLTGRAGRLTGRAGPAGQLRTAASRRAVRQVALLIGYLAAGIAVTWPRATYIRGLLPATRDVASYVWDLQWTAHQIIHLGNPWFTTQMAAPAGIQLGFDTTMPLVGLVMTPVTLAFGPSAAFTLLTIVAPGLACYVMYRAARLWLAGPGAIAAGALFGLSSMLAWQDWY
ncbi:MAG: hypothetical protein ABSB01_22220, partial [Streptosporangiaceae bacterium]